MTVITDRVLRHVCRKAWWNIERESARRSMGGRGTSGRETKASTRAGVTKYPGPEGEIKAGSFPRWDPSIEGGKGIREKEGKKPVFGNRYHRCRSERPMPFNRLISLRRQNSLPHCCLSHNWLLPRVTVLAPRKNSKNRPFFRSSPLLFFYLSFLRKLFLRGFIPPRRALSRLLPYSLYSGLFLLIFDLLPCIF